MANRETEEPPIETQDYQFNYIKPHDNHIMRVKRFRKDRSSQPSKKNTYRSINIEPSDSFYKLQ